MERIADEYFRIGDYEKALEGYLTLDSLQPGNTGYNYQIGICYLHTSSKSKAYPYLEFVYQQEDPPESLLYDLARAYHYGMEFERAIIYYESFKKQIQFGMHSTQTETKDITKIDLFIQQCRNGTGMVRDPLLNTSVVNMGPAVNSTYTDFGPLINKNEDLLIFSSKRRANEHTKSDPLTGQYYESIFYSNLVNGKWSAANAFGAPINRDEVHNAAVGLSPDGKTLFIYQGDDDRLSARIAGDVLVSQYDNNQWIMPRDLDVINSKAWESSASVSEDESILVFSSDREGGFGGIDLYITRKTPDGEWSVPENIGGYINTPFNEDGPFLHPDGNKLYFSSNGLQSMGGYDIFYSEFQEGINRWTRPVNMGFPINTSDDDIFFVWSADGERAYFSSDREDTYGKADIYMFVREDQNNVLTHVTGIVSDRITQSPVGAELSVRDLWNNNLIGIFESHHDNGSYSIALKSGREYSVTVDAEGYKNENIRILIPRHSDKVPFIKNVTLTRKK
jgi:hypothetical protein